MAALAFYNFTAFSTITYVKAGSNSEIEQSSLVWENHKAEGVDIALVLVKPDSNGGTQKNPRLRLYVKNSSGQPISYIDYGLHKTFYTTVIDGNGTQKLIRDYDATVSDRAEDIEMAGIQPGAIMFFEDEITSSEMQKIKAEAVYLQFSIYNHGQNRPFKSPSEQG